MARIVKTTTNCVTVNNYKIGLSTMVNKYHYLNENFTLNRCTFRTPPLKSNAKSLFELNKTKPGRGGRAV